ncbi:MAG: phosphogluconate dehydrogenase (NAD(+)-dependent, decarboxylating) [Thermodesulfobacteriota bacterium]
MRIGLAGLGRMGMNMVRRLVQGGHEVVAYNRTPAKVDEIAKEGAIPAYTLAELVSKLPAPRVVWLMLPAGDVTEEHVEELKPLLQKGDILVEGGNSRFTDDIRRAPALAELGVTYLDAGVSGGIWGLKVGYCTMVGGPREAFERIEPVLKTLAPPEGYLHCGSTGSGHYVKMVHNAIEYGMMQAYAEGFALLDACRYSRELDFQKLSHLWNQGSVIRSWLLELAEDMFAKDARLDGLKAYVDDSGEGRWSVQEAVDNAVPAPVLTLALMERFRSRKENDFGDRVLAGLRNEFGGHAVVRKEK